MNCRLAVSITFLFYNLAFPMTVNGHTGLDSDAGVLSNIIATALVMVALLIYYLTRKRKKHE